MKHRWTADQLRRVRPDAFHVIDEPAQEIVTVVKRPKYGNTKQTIDNIVFDSGGEAGHYETLKLLQKAGIITQLRVHPTYDIVVCGVRVCGYTADFAYQCDGLGIVEDWKSKFTKTPVYRLKKKLLLATQGIEIREVSQ